VVISGAQIRIAQPVMGDVDPLRALEAVRACDVGMVLSEERSPRELDDLTARVDRDLESRVEVVRGKGWAWCHA
jgi:hypothetical protein